MIVAVGLRVGAGVGVTVGVGVLVGVAVGVAVGVGVGVDATASSDIGVAVGVELDPPHATPIATMRRSKPPLRYFVTFLFFTRTPPLVCSAYYAWLAHFCRFT